MARRALLIAADRYEDPGFRQLRAPSGDVSALREVLADPDLGGFEVSPPLIDADHQAIREQLEDFFGEADFDDLLLLYMSCHGELRHGRLHFATTTTRRDRLQATAISDRYVHDLMESAHAATTVLILDCCHSGAFGRGLAAKGQAVPSVDLGNLEGTGVVTLAASDAVEFSFEDETAAPIEADRAGSVFTKVLVDGLRTGAADHDGDGKVSVEELYRYLWTEVRRRNPNQSPRRRGDTSGDVLIARNPHATRLPAELLADLRDPAWHRRAGVAGLLRGHLHGSDPGLARAAREALDGLRSDPDRRVAQAAEEAVAAAAPESRADPAEATAPSTEAPGGPAPPASPAAARLLRRALELRGRGTYDAAEAAYSELVERDPGLIEAHVGRAEARRRLGRLQDALADCDAALSRHPDHVDALATRARVRADWGDGAAALADADRALELDAACVEALTARGWAHIARQEPAAAKDAFALALGADAEHADALAGRAMALVALHRGDEAEVDLDRALALDAGYAVTLAVRALLDWSRGLLDPARQRLDEGLALSPRDFGCLTLRASMSLQSGAGDAAIEDLDTAIEVAPGRWLPRMWRALAKLGRGAHDEALADLQPQLAPDAARDGLAGVRAVALAGLGRGREALADLDGRSLEPIGDGAGPLLVRALLRLADERVDHHADFDALVAGSGDDAFDVLKREPVARLLLEVRATGSVAPDGIAAAMPLRASALAGLATAGSRRHSSDSRAIRTDRREALHRRIGELPFAITFYEGHDLTGTGVVRDAEGVVDLAERLRAIARLESLGQSP